MVIGLNSPPLIFKLLAIFEKASHKQCTCLADKTALVSKSLSNVFMGPLHAQVIKLACAAKLKAPVSPCTQRLASILYLFFGNAWHPHMNKACQQCARTQDVFSQQIHLECLMPRQEDAAIISAVSFQTLSHDLGFFFGSVRDCYEAYVIFCFFAWLLAVQVEGAIVHYVLHVALVKG